jgi:hypothetical protein
MGDAADDMFDSWMELEGYVLCDIHQHYYDPRHACGMCEDGEPPVTTERSN